MKDMVKEWIRQAGEELGMAEHLLRGGYHKGACFHAQQAVEKSVKALLLDRGWELEKTHSIGRLIALAEEYHVSAPITDEETVFMDSIYRGRYPAEAGLLPLGDPSEADAMRAIEISRRVLERARSTRSDGNAPPPVV